MALRLKKPFSNVFFTSKTQAVSVPVPVEIGNVIKGVVDFAIQLNLKVDSDDVQELLDTTRS